jgi:hypothetical protein
MRKLIGNKKDDEFAPQHTKATLNKNSNRYLILRDPKPLKQLGTALICLTFGHCQLLRLLRERHAQLLNGANLRPILRS